MSARWHRVAGAAEIAPGQVRAVRVGDRVLAVGRAEETWFCVDDVCPHAGGSLGEGSLDGPFLICPVHGFAYDVRDGRCEEDPVPVEVFPIRVVDGHLEVQA